MKLLLVNLVAVTHPSGHTRYLDAIKIAPNSIRKHRKFSDKSHTEFRCQVQFLLHHQPQLEFGLINSYL